jgi:hypothetical protein
MKSAEYWTGWKIISCLLGLPLYGEMGRFKFGISGDCASEVGRRAFDRATRGPHIIADVKVSFCVFLELQTQRRSLGGVGFDAFFRLPCFAFAVPW